MTFYYETGENMFCNNCVKLAYLHTKKKCIRCQSEVLNNISILCVKCSGTEGVCSVCLRKNRSSIANKSTYNYPGGGCKTCGS